MSALFGARLQQIPVNERALAGELEVNQIGRNFLRLNQASTFFVEGWLGFVEGWLWVTSDDTARGAQTVSPLAKNGVK